jgi:VIT1/CCC1 family predicted Fe2+/Mn2+ transporter
MAAANLARTAIVVAGLAAFYQAKFDDERRDVAEFSQRERVQLSVVLEREGLPRAEAERVAVGLAANPNVLLRTKAEKELGLSPEVGGAARGDGIDVGLPCVPTTIVPLWPYVVLGRGSALVLSVGCTLVAPFAIGVLKGRAARQAQVGDGLQVLLIGCLVAAVGFGIEHLAATLV